MPVDDLLSRQEGGPTSRIKGRALGANRNSSTHPSRRVRVQEPPLRPHSHPPPVDEAAPAAPAGPSSRPYPLARREPQIHAQVHMRVIMRPHHDGGVEPPPALKARFYPISGLELPLLFFTFS